MLSPDGEYFSTPTKVMNPSMFNFTPQAKREIKNIIANEEKPRGLTSRQPGNADDFWRLAFTKPINDKEKQS